MNEKPCHDCGALTPYEPIMILGTDITASMPHRCKTCEDASETIRKRKEHEDKVERIKALYEATVPPEYRATDKDHPDFNRTMWDEIRRLPWTSRPIGLVGLPGRCKTRMLALAAKRVIYTGLTIGWANTFDLERATRDVNDRTHTATARTLLREWRTCRVLFLDDLGKSRWSAYLEAALFEVLEYRHAHSLVTHWSLNPQPDDADEDFTRADVLAAALDPEQRTSQGNRFAPILSRLVNNTLIIPVK